MQTQGSLPVGGTATNGVAPLATDDGGVIDTSGRSFGGSIVNGHGTWSQAIHLTSVTVSPLAGKTQQLAAVIANPQVKAQGDVQDITVNGPGTVAVSGAITVPTLVDDGTVSISTMGSLIVSSAVDPSSAGLFELTSKSALELASYLGASLKIEFAGGSDRLTVDNASDFGVNVGSASYAGPLIEGFKSSDAIELKGIASAGLTLSYAASTGDLQIASSGSAAATLAFQNSSLGAGTFHTASDGAGGTLLLHS